MSNRSEQKFKNSKKIKIYILKFSNFIFIFLGFYSSRTGPVIASVSRALTLLNLPGAGTGGKSKSTLAVWAAVPRLPVAWVSMALCDESASLNLPWLYLRLNTGILSSSAAAAAAVEPAVAKQVQVALDSEVQVQVYWQVDPSPFEFERTVTNFEVEV